MRRLAVTWLVALLGVTATGMEPGAAVHAQSVTISGPPEPTLTTVTPTFTVRATGFGPARPMRLTVQISTTMQFGGDVVFDSTVVTNDTIVAITALRVLPSGANVYWKARAQALAGPIVESTITGPRTVPVWLTLLSPNSASGDILDSRHPRFVWRSPFVNPLLGPWRYDISIINQGRVEQNAAGVTDTVWQAVNELDANTSYRWQVRASLPNGMSLTVISLASFVITDLPTLAKTLVYQNFPNPFPSAAGFATCIWFDVAEPGARVALDVLDLRGNLVRTLIPGADGQRDFLPGRYGQGVPGLGSSCNNRFVWDGTGNDGRTVAAGVYLLRFQAGRQTPTFRRMMFLGR